MARNARSLVLQRSAPSIGKPRGPIALVWLALLLATARWAAAADAVELDVLTYNIRGLPTLIAGDAPRDRLTRLLPRLAPFAIAMLQEDFAHQDLVTALAPHRHHLRAPMRPRDWRATTGDGLTVLTVFSPVGARIATPYRVCHGYFSAASDCFADKGVLGQRLRLAQGITLDVYTTHLDAGRSDGDEDARRAQLATLERTLRSHSADQALLLGGDFNLHADRPAQWRTLDAFRERLGLRLAAAVPRTDRKRVDYLFVRDGTDVSVDVLRTYVPRTFVDATGAPLSDHPPLAARLRILGRATDQTR